MKFCDLVMRIGRRLGGHVATFTGGQQVEWRWRWLHIEIEVDDRGCPTVLVSLVRRRAG